MNKVPLGDVCQINPSKAKDIDPNIECSFIPMEYIDDHLGLIVNKSIKKVGEVEKGYTSFRDGDVLFAKITPCMENGKCAVAKGLTNGIGFGSTEFHVIRAGNSITADWIYYFLRQDRLRQDAERRMTGSAGQRRVPTGFMEEVLIPLPFINDQERITGYLKKADRLRRLRRYALQLGNTYLQSVFLEMFGDLRVNSNCWPKSRLGDNCIRVTDGTHQPPAFVRHGIPFLFVHNIVTGELDLHTEKYISTETHLALTKRCPIERGDILYSSVGSYGVGVVVDTDRPFAFQRHIAHIKPDRSKLNSTFLKAMLNSKYVKQQADVAARGVAQKTLNLEEIRDLEIYLPPMAIQQQFARVAQKYERLRAQQRESERQAEHLFQTLLHQVFSGNAMEAQEICQTPGAELPTTPTHSNSLTTLSAAGLPEQGRLPFD